MRWALAIAASLIALVSLLVYTVDSKEKLVAHSYRSWYTELGQGAAAGLAAYRQAEQYAAELGMSEDIAATKIRKKIEQLQKIVAATQN